MITLPIFCRTAVRLATATFLALALALTASFSALARRQKLPDSNVFSSPDATDSAVLPTFVGAGGKPINEGKTPRVPDFNTIRMIPDLSKDQLKQIEAFRKLAQIGSSTYRDQIAQLNEQLDAARAHPADMVFINGKPLKKVDAIRNDINDCRKQIDAKNNEQYAAALAILTDKQKDELDRIRRGLLIINGAQNADGKPGKIQHEPSTAAIKKTTVAASKHASFWKRLFGRG